MRLIRFVVLTSIAAIIAAPAFAAANPAASLALGNGQSAGTQTDNATSTPTGAGTSVGRKSHTGTIVLAGVAVAAVVGGAVALGTSHHHDNLPASN
jgi:hypothetical protein